jgi:ABC-type nitrate/sulfonate/bicarbonate transport system permease component
MTAARRSGEIAIGILPIALVIALWHAIAMSGIAPAVLLPPPAAVFARLLEQAGNPLFLEQVGITLFRLFAGFSIALVVGVTLGVAATGSKLIESLIKPLVRVLAPLPKVALYPAMVLILGFDDASKIALVVADAVFPILLATWQGTSAVDTKLVWSARAAGCPSRRALFTVVLMAALPSVLTGCHHLVHRGVSRRDDHLDRRPRLPAGARGPQLPDRRHVRAADLDFDPGTDAECGVQCTAQVVIAGVCGGGVTLSGRRAQ